MKLKKVMGVVVAAAMAVSMTACSAVDITAIGLPTEMALEKGDTTQLSIEYDAGDASEEAIAEAANKLELVWESSDEEVATVDETGLVTAVDAGEADITVSVKDGNLSSTCHITVNITATGIEAPADMTLEINGEAAKSLEVKTVPEDATNVKLTYTSSDENVATVDENGMVTAVGNGECVITTTASTPIADKAADEEASDTDSSVAESTAQSDVSSVPESVPAEKASSVPADASSVAEDATTEETNEEVQDVMVWTAETKVTVTTAPTGITLSSEGGKLYVGNSANIKVYTTPEEASAANAAEVKYTSSDESVATVVGTTEGEAAFTVKGVKAGTATITVEYKGHTATYTVTVTKYVSNSGGSTSTGGGTGSGGTSGGSTGGSTGGSAGGSTGGSTSTGGGAGNGGTSGGSTGGSTGGGNVVSGDGSAVGKPGDTVIEIDPSEGVDGGDAAPPTDAPMAPVE